MDQRERRGAGYKMRIVKARKKDGFNESLLKVVRCGYDTCVFNKGGSSTQYGECVNRNITLLVRDVRLTDDHSMEHMECKNYVRRK